MNTPKKVALYARVSTSDQRAASQVHALRQLAEQRGWVIFKEYIDEGTPAPRTGVPPSTCS